MKKLTDEEIQRLFEGHIIIEPDNEVVTYQKVYSELSKFPDVCVDNLVQDVMFSIENKVEQEATIKTYLAIAVSLAIAFFVFTVVSFSIDKLLTLKILSFLNNFKWVIVFLITFMGISSVSEKLYPFAKHSR
jgi:uncharacterized membrane protein